MADKHPITTTRTGSDAKAGKHGSFKHTAKPASVKAALSVYGMTEKSFAEVKEYVFGRLEKKPAHVR